MKKDYNFGYTKVNSKQKTKLVQNVFSSVAPSYDIMNDLMSLGMHRLWKKRFVEIMDIEENEIILDVGSGSGDIASEILKENIPSSLYLLDLNEEMLLEGRKRLRKDILLVIDDAYYEYMKDKKYASGLEIFKNYQNVFILRTFSKIYGLAALRIGWGYGDKKIIDALNFIKPPFNVNEIAQLCAIAVSYTHLTLPTKRIV